MDRGSSTVTDFHSGPASLVIAHRGNSRHAPENTLPAFAAAVALGVDAVELDYHEAADGALVVIHDSDLSRTTNAVAIWGRERLEVCDRTWPELATLDAGARFSPRFAGTRLPTLAEALAAIGPATLTVIERKTGGAGPLCRQLSDLGIIERVVVQAFDWDFLAECRGLEPRLAITALGEHALTGDRLDAAAQCGASTVGWDEAELDAEAVAAILGRGLKAWAWTVDDPVRQRSLLSWGVSGLITNDPGPLLKLLGRD